MELEIFKLDAFTGRVFGGNPAAVVLAPSALPEDLMRAIARENNLPATAFVSPAGSEFAVRWFTTEIEIDLCGHGTLASAHVLFEHGHAAGPEIVFHYPGGKLSVARDGDRCALTFPARPAVSIAPPPELAAGLGAAAREVYKARDILAVFESEAEIAAIQPDGTTLARIEAFGIIVTAPGTQSDFVSRFFAPRAGIAEDPATGSSHCTLVPYWSGRLDKTSLHGLQLSSRGGEMFCEDRGEHVRIGGRCVEFLRGRITV